MTGPVRCTDRAERCSRDARLVGHACHPDRWGCRSPAVISPCRRVSTEKVSVGASDGQFLMGASGGRFRRNGVGKKVLLSAEEGRIDGKEDADGAGKTGKIDFIRRNGVFGAEVIIKKGWLVAPLIKEFFVVVEEPAKVV